MKLGGIYPEGVVRSGRQTRLAQQAHPLLHGVGHGSLGGAELRHKAEHPVMGGRAVAAANRKGGGVVPVGHGHRTRRQKVFTDDLGKREGVVQQQNVVQEHRYKKEGLKSKPAQRVGVRGRNFSGPWKVQGGKTSGSEAAGQKVQSSSDAMGLGALAVRCQRKARMCCQQSMDLAAVRHTIAASNVLGIWKAFTARPRDQTADADPAPAGQCRTHHPAARRNHQSSPIALTMSFSSAKAFLAKALYSWALRYSRRMP